MSRLTNTAHQTNLFGTELLQQLDAGDPLLQLASAIPWSELEQAFAKHYTPGVGRPPKPIRLMVGLEILKFLENLSDEKVVVQFKRNPYYQAFCGLTEFSLALPCDSTDLVYFRKRIGTEGYEKLFQISVQLHGKVALDETVNIDSSSSDQGMALANCSSGSPASSCWSSSVPSGESLFLRKLVLGIPAQASGKNLTRPPMPSAPRKKTENVIIDLSFPVEKLKNVTSHKHRPPNQSIAENPGNVALAAAKT
jgi:hypothetical protein